MSRSLVIRDCQSDAHWFITTLQLCVPEHPNLMVGLFFKVLKKRAQRPVLPTLKDNKWFTATASAHCQCHGVVQL